MSKHRKFPGLTVAAMAIAGLLAGASGTALAAGGVPDAQDMSSERVTRAPHKVANQFHRRHVIKETAEFARLEIAPEGASDSPRRSLIKSGNRFHKAN